ncbi:hypothetical protein AURDEDRAFT_182428 [Auricularia subglabra TFB-10046 SS5]|nr:hypothetical protein AURDEDRAFT_182428 [Auricularia subglabra TFB-10046 SS5]
MDRAGQNRFGFSVWLGDEERVVPWSDKLANAPWNGVEWIAILHDAVKSAFGYPRSCKLDLVYEDKAGEERKLLIGQSGIKRSEYWGSLPERVRDGPTCKNGRIDIKGVRGLPNLDFKVSFRGEKKLVSWPRQKEVADSVANDEERPWTTIQNLIRQTFNLSYETTVTIMVEDPDGDDVFMRVLADARMWNKFLTFLPLEAADLRTIQIKASVRGEPVGSEQPYHKTVMAHASPGNPMALGFPVRKVAGKVVALPMKARFISGEHELATFWISGSTVKGSEAERWIDNWNNVRQSLEDLFRVPSALTRSLEIVDATKTAITLSTPWCWRTFSELLSASEKRIRHLEVDIASPTPNIKIIAASTGVQPGAGAVSPFEVRHIKDTPVVFFALDSPAGPGARTVTHIAKWEKTSADESWDAEWARVHNHIRDLFALDETAAYVLYYVDDDRDEIALSTPDCWKNFIAFVNRNKNVVRTMHVRLNTPLPAPEVATQLPVIDSGSYFAGGFQEPGLVTGLPTPYSPTGGSTSSTLLMQELTAESETLARELARAKQEAQAQREARAQLAQTLSQTTARLTQQIAELTNHVAQLTAENTALAEKNEMLRAGMSF